MSNTFKTGDRVRSVIPKTAWGVLPEGAEGVVKDDQEGYYLYVAFEGYDNPYDGELDDEVHRNTWALTADEVALVEAAA